MRKPKDESLGNAGVSLENEVVTDCDGDDGVDRGGGSSGSKPDIWASSKHNSQMVVSGWGAWRTLARSVVFPFGRGWSCTVG